MMLNCNALYHFGLTLALSVLVAVKVFDRRHVGSEWKNNKRTQLGRNHINTNLLEVIADCDKVQPAFTTGMNAGPSSQPWPSLSGSVPGVLDSSQRTRLMRSTDSVLSFASFDPHTAAAHEPQESLEARRASINQDPHQPKRIVIETTGSGEQFWRFVPRARRDEGVEHEGRWPRLIDLCG